MEREDSLDALSVRNAAHSECLVESAPFTADHHAGKYLDSLFVTFYDPRVNAYTVADRKRRQIGFLLFFVDDVDDAIHKPVQPRGCGRTLSFGGVDFATRIPAAQDRREFRARRAFNENEHQDA